MLETVFVFYAAIPVILAGTFCVIDRVLNIGE